MIITPSAASITVLLSYGEAQAIALSLRQGEGYPISEELARKLVKALDARQLAPSGPDAQAMRERRAAQAPLSQHALGDWERLND